KLFFEKLGLQAPAIAWSVSRDRLAEWLNLLTLMTATADRIGHEIYNLQRPEIAEVSEGFVPGTVGSITMPQKRNPEISEHLGTLARTVRYHAAQMNENLVHDHERDGRAWKSEWAVVPGACLMTQKAVALLQILLRHLQVHEDCMRENLAASKGFVFAEQVMLALTPHLGKQSAHTLVYRVAMAAGEQGMAFKDALLAEAEIVSLLGANGIDEAFDVERGTGSCGAMVDQVLAAVKAWNSKHA
ncbi:lyase family protein, partial [Methylomonas sp. MgM2]